MTTINDIRAILQNKGAGKYGGTVLPTANGSGTSRKLGGRAGDPSPTRSPAYLQAARDQALATRGQVEGFDRQSQMVRSELQRALPRLDWEAQDRIEQTDDSFRSRGLFNSGSRLAEGANVRRDLAADYSDLRQRASESVQDLQSRAAQAVLAGRASLANAGLAAYGDLASQQSAEAIAEQNRRQALVSGQLRDLLAQYGRG